MEWEKDGFTISTDKHQLCVDAIYGYLQRSYWAQDRPRAAVERSITNSAVVFGVYQGDRQVGFARVVSDLTVYAYLCDVFILEEYQGQGLGKWLISCVIAHPELRGVRKWMLATRDAHGLYQKVGFTPLAQPEKYMELLKSRRS